MSLFFKVEDKIVVPFVETLLIHPFKEIWERDSTPSKEFATEDFAYMEFSVSLLRSNPFRGYSGEIKEQKIRSAIITRDDWNPDDLMFKGMMMIEEFQMKASRSMSYYLSVVAAVEKMENYFNTFDISEVNIKTGNPLMKPKDITSAITDTTKLLENLYNLREKVEQELFETTRTQGQKTISPFAQI